MLRAALATMPLRLDPRPRALPARLVVLLGATGPGHAQQLQHRHVQVVVLAPMPLRLDPRPRALLASAAVVQDNI